MRPDFDSPGLQENSGTFVAVSGPTSGRPTFTLPVGGLPALSTGARYYDTTLSLLLTYDGTTWRDEAGTSR
jgi:hypothetical protein